MNPFRTPLIAVLFIGAVACTKKDDDGGSATSSGSAAAPTPAASVTADPKAAAKPAVEPRVRTEVDGRPDGLTGSPMSAQGATATLQTPKGWEPTKGELTILGAPDKKAQLAVAAFNPAEGPAPKLPAAATAFGLTDCEWSPPEPLTVGKGKLSAVAADGVCKRGPTIVRTAYVAPSAEKLLVIGAWEPDGDSASVFGSMRSITKVVAADPLAACCAALRQNARSAPPDQAPYYVMAANMCDGLRASPQGRAQISQIRAGLRGANLPGACR